MQPEFGAATAGLDTDQSYALVIDKRMKHPDGIAASADAGEDRIREPVLVFQNLPARLLADDAMEIANHHGIGMRTERRSKQVMRRLDIRDPIAHSLANGVLQGSAASGDAHDFSAQQTHAKDVETLAAHVLLAHIDDAFQA